MTATTLSLKTLKGGSFLIQDSTPGQTFTPEGFSDEQRTIAKTTETFWNQEVAPNLKAIQDQQPGVAIRVLKKSAELGLPAVVVPEKFGGIEMDLISAMVVVEGLSKDGSYCGWHIAHSGIGMLPLLLFGTEDQKQGYLPKLAKAEMIGAYCLSEPQAGSDALSARTRADPTADGGHYVLNGQKMWITNGGAADLYTVFAKVGGEKFTAFLVERVWPGVQPGSEEKKMGLKGSSTTAVYFDNVKVPANNVLGEIGRGHVIAFNILNLGRLNMGPIALGGAKEVLRNSLRYAKDRKAFGKSIGDFGMIRHKLAEMAIRIFAAESATYRVAGMIEAELEGFSWDQPDASQRMMKAAEEFATECSYIKVFASEMLDYVADEGVQIHGGCGYHQDYAVEHAYRDCRSYRIVEGTNEVNRLLATSMLLKRAQRGQLPLVEAVKKLQDELLSGPSLTSNDASGSLGAEKLIAVNARKTALFCLCVAYQESLNVIEEEQEVLAGITDVAMNAFAIESVVLRTQKMLDRGKGEIAADMCAVFVREAAETVESCARYVLAASSAGDCLRTSLAILRRFTEFVPINAVELRRKIAARLLHAERYMV
jgi:butyryl-CoA dehydrogenase